jgi:hypothetical protein
MENEIKQKKSSCEYFCLLYENTKSPANIPRIRMVLMLPIFTIFSFQESFLKILKRMKFRVSDQFINNKVNKRKL